MLNRRYSYDPLPPPGGTQYDYSYFSGISSRRNRGALGDDEAEADGSWTAAGIVQALRQLVAGEDAADPDTQAALQEQIALLAEHARHPGQFPGADEEGDGELGEDGAAGDGGALNRIGGLLAGLLARRGMV